MKKEIEAPICPRCRQVVDTQEIMLDGICEECVADRERKQRTKARLFRSPPFASEHNASEKPA